MDTLGIALSGMQSASTRIAASAHNVANLLTEGFRPQRVTQSAQASGGSQAAVATGPTSGSVNLDPNLGLDLELDHEIVDQIVAKTQYKASARVIRVESEMRGSLLDIFA
jgi:flagellar hook protein FlgE